MKKKTYFAAACLGLALVQITACKPSSPPQSTSPATETAKESETGQASSSPSSETAPSETPQGSEAGSAAPASSSQTPASETTPKGASQDSYIGEEEAKSIALEHAGVREADITGPFVSFEMEDGQAEYEVEFYVENKEYDYQIDAATGTILGFDYDAEHDLYASGEKASNQEETITEEEARSIALEQVPGAADSDLRIKTDYDDSRLVYEGDILYEGTEYEFEIDAGTGELLKWEVDR